MSEATKTKKTPDYNIHVKVPVGVETKIGAAIGVAFKHNEGEGLNLILDAQPIAYNGRIELVAFPVSKS